MSSHRFQPGQQLQLSLNPLHPGTSIVCTVIQLLPFEDGAFQYRVKCFNEDFDRTASEKNLTALERSPVGLNLG
jgi:hypothetical protein